MRYQLPEGCDAICVAGVTLDVGKDGTVEADAALADTLAAHGIVPVPDDPPPERGAGRGRT